MKEIIVETQKQLDSIKEIKPEEKVIVKKLLKLKANLPVFGSLVIEVGLDTEWGRHVVAWGNSTPHVVAWENSAPHVVARENSAPHVEAWGTSTPHVEAWGTSTPHVVAWENSVIHGMKLSAKATLNLFGFSIAVVPASLKIKIKKSKTAIIQKVSPQDWFEQNGVEKKSKVVLYKRVSKDFKTQENTSNETLWTIGSIVRHPNYRPKENECGEGKFHACSRPYFCDEFRNAVGDRYIAIEIVLKDLYEWKDNPQCPHKIGFRQGKVLYECDRYGEKVEVVKEALQVATLALKIAEMFEKKI